MSIKFTNNLDVASKVLTALNQIIPKSLEENCTVETYSNCREQGYSIFCVRSDKISIRVSFSEYRNTDDIVVYFGKMIDFDFSNIPSETIYQNAKFFSYNKVVDAADFICEFLQGENNKEQKKRKKKRKEHDCNPECEYNLILNKMKQKENPS